MTDISLPFQFEECPSFNDVDSSFCEHCSLVDLCFEYSVTYDHND